MVHPVSNNAPSNSSPYKANNKRRGCCCCCCSPWICLTTLFLVMNGTLLLGTIWANYNLLSADLVQQEHAMMKLLDKEKNALWSASQELQRQLRPETQYHIIFSTGCSKKQHLQSYVLFHSILVSGQAGEVTRIASGCSTEEAEELQWIQRVQIEPMGRKVYNKVDKTYSDISSDNSRFHLHLTPDFGKDHGFHYLNKPYGVADWMERVLEYSAAKTMTIHDDTIIILLDPDMIVLRPFVDNDFSNQKELWKPRTTFPIRMRVDHGYPMAAEYGYGSLWYRKTDLSKVMSPQELASSPLSKMSDPVIEENFAAGPPYMATARDFYAIVDKWREFSKPVHDQNPESILTEMYAYSLAAAHLNLPHQLAQSFMISTEGDEAFGLVQQPSENRLGGFTGGDMCRNIPVEYKPHILHYCHRYSLGKYVMGKHRLPETFVGHPDTCDSPLLAEPPDAAAHLFNFYIDPDTHMKHEIVSKNGARTNQDKINQMTFLLCEELSALNQAAIYFKKQHCEHPNLQKTLIFHDTLELTEEERVAKAVPN